MEIETLYFRRFYELFRAEFVRKEALYLKGRPETSPTIWEAVDEDRNNIALKIFGGGRIRSEFYFYRLYDSLKPNKVNIGLVNDFAFLKALKYTGYDLPEKDRDKKKYSTISELTLIYKQFREDNERFILDELRQNSPNLVLGNLKIEKNNQLNIGHGRDSFNSAMQAKAYHYLKNSNWWLYYANDNLAHRTDTKKGWLLYRAIISFSDETGNDLEVTINNKINVDTVEYIGYTDFTHSSATVLVMNFVRKISFERQLNIKINIGEGDGNLYLGQYLNYNEEGHIISGAVMLVKIDDYTPTLKPESFNSKDLAKSNEYPEVTNLAFSFFRNIDKNFRRTPTRVKNIDRLKELLEKGANDLKED